MKVLTARDLLPLVLALMVCHGVLGGLHAVSGAWGAAGPADHTLHGGASACEASGAHCPAADGYAAVLQGALAALALLLFAPFRRVACPQASRATGVLRFEPGSPPRARAPDLCAVLQVFRL